jgi:hypothetical protein
MGHTTDIGFILQIYVNFRNSRCKISHNSAIIAIFAQIFKRFYHYTNKQT